MLNCSLTFVPLKVADFGLASTDGATIDSGKLPIKWTAPEVFCNVWKKTTCNLAGIEAFSLLQQVWHVELRRVALGDLLVRKSALSQNSSWGCCEACWEGIPGDFQVAHLNFRIILGLSQPNIADGSTRGMSSPGVHNHEGCKLQLNYHSCI